jgi:uncharacterized protein involved in exopolysaccharide biosynthesis
MSRQPSGNPLQDAITELVQRWRVLIAFPIVAGVAGVVLSIVVPSEYESVSIFSPAEDLSSSLPGNLQAIAAQFGITPPSSGYSVYYFAQVLQSRAVLGRAAVDTLKVAGSAIAVSEVLGTAGMAESERIDETIKKVDKAIRTRTDDQADLVTLTVTAKSPQLAEALANSILAALDSVTTASLRRGGSAERRFAQAQSDSAHEALRRSEDQLGDFYASNRSLATSPTLQAVEARLRRQIQIRQDLYLALINQAEAAKLREVRNTPAIALIQPPQASSERAWPKAAAWALFGAIGALVIAATWLYVVRPLVPTPALARFPRQLQ